jgi:hypothetical protein
VQVYASSNHEQSILGSITNSISVVTHNKLLESLEAPAGSILESNIRITFYWLVHLPTYG